MTWVGTCHVDRGLIAYGSSLKPQNRHNIGSQAAMMHPISIGAKFGRRVQHTARAGCLAEKSAKNGSKMQFVRPSCGLAAPFSGAAGRKCHNTTMLSKKLKMKKLKNTTKKIKTLEK